MGDVVIIGGGFAGLAAGHTLAKNRKKLQGRGVFLVDDRGTFDFLPVLPDIVSGRLKPADAQYDISGYLKRRGVHFQKGRVTKIDLVQKRVILENGSSLGYEYLVLACGSQANYFGLNDIQKNSMTLLSVQDAAALHTAVRQHPLKHYVVVGGGYTGIETASNIALSLRRSGQKKYRVSIVEKADDILGSLPEWMKEYCRLNLCRLRVNIYCGCSLKEISPQKIVLSNGLVMEDPQLVWSAGVRAACLVDGLDVKKDTQGRILVGGDLRFADGAFAAGDVAGVERNGRVIRLAIQFSIAQGAHAARNIVRCIQCRPTAGFRPVDLGWLVPLANRKACGKILFFRAWGWLGWALHYIMCLYRSMGWRNRWRIVLNAFVKFWR